MSIFDKFIAESQSKIAMKRRLLADVRSGVQAPGKGMTKEETIKVLIETIAEEERLVELYRGRDYA